MGPHLRVLAGTSPDNMKPISSIVNTNKTHKLSSEFFEGEVVANIKGFTDEEGAIRDSEYFSREDRQGITWSIQVQGRFLKPISADDVLFGNTFDRPLKLPWGSGAALKFMSYVDPTLEHDLTSTTKPWALSPLISTMPHFVHSRIPGSPGEADSHHLKPPSPNSKGLTVSSPPTFPPTHSIADDTSHLHLAMTEESSSGSASSASSSTSSLSSILSSSARASVTSLSGQLKSGSKLKDGMKKKRRKALADGTGLHLQDASQRRSYFSTASHRQAVIFGPNDVISTDFCYGFLEFSPTLSLRLPGGVSFDLMRYWDGQPVRFVCCERKDPVDNDANGDPWGRMLWCVAIEMAGDEGKGHEKEAH